MQLFCKDTEKWLYKLPEDYSWNCGRTFTEDMEFKDDTKGKVRLKISKNGDVTVISNYSWDGCSPKYCFFDILLGTPEGAVYTQTGRPKTYLASLIHDAFYQFLDNGIPFERNEVDLFFLKMMEETHFKPRWIYYLAVKYFGGISRWYGLAFGKKKRKIIEKKEG